VTSSHHHRHQSPLIADDTDPHPPPVCIAGSHPGDDHWAVRREAAALLSAIARQFAAPHHNLQPRLCKVLAQALLDADKQLTSKYGAIVGLQVSHKAATGGGGGPRACIGSAGLFGAFL
jgi:hypothetical protein